MHLDEFQFTVTIPREDYLKLNILAKESNLRFTDLIEPERQQLKNRLKDLASLVDLSYKVTKPSDSQTTQ